MGLMSGEISIAPMTAAGLFRSKPRSAISEDKTNIAKHTTSNCLLSSASLLISAVGRNSSRKRDVRQITTASGLLVFFAF
jgi:hypothetical protein